MMEIILASASLRREWLLHMLGLEFATVAPDVDETPHEGESAERLAERLAGEKAASVLGDYPEALIIAADTVVDCDGIILGKPRDNADALRMLQLLSGRAHQVITGLVMLYREQQFLYTGKTVVKMPEHDEALLRAYVACGEPAGKSGGYAVQGRGGVLVSAVEGDIYNVIGLPIHALWRGFQALGCSHPFLQAFGG